MGPTGLKVRLLLIYSLVASLARRCGCSFAISYRDEVGFETHSVPVWLDEQQEGESGWHDANVLVRQSLTESGPGRIAFPNKRPREY